MLYLQRFNALIVGTLFRRQHRVLTCGFFYHFYSLIRKLMLIYSLQTERSLQMLRNTHKILLNLSIFSPG
jgi:hypothetical protein